jgi:hypothetical protein
LKTDSKKIFMTPEPTVAKLRSSAQRSQRKRQLSLRYSERKLLLSLFDLLLVNLAFVVALHFRAQNDVSVRGAENHLQWFVLLSLVWLGCATVVGCYDLVRAASVPRALGHSAVALVATWAIYLGIPYMTPTLPASRLDLLWFPVLGITGLAAWRVVYATVFAHPNFQQRALIIGAGEAGRTLARAVCEMGARRVKSGEEIDESEDVETGATQTQNRAFDAAASSIGYRVLGFVDDNIERGTTLEGAQVLGTRYDLPRLVQRLQVNELVVAITHLETMNAELFEAIQECREWGVSITTMTDLYERLTGRVPIEHAGRALAVAMPVVQKPTHRFYLVFQRFVDIVGALVGCVLLGGLFRLCGWPIAPNRPALILLSGTGWQRWAPISDREISLHANRRRKVRRGVGRGKRSAHHADWTNLARHTIGRSPAVLEHSARRYEPHRAAPGTASFRRSTHPRDSVLPRAPCGENRV